MQLSPFACNTCIKNQYLKKNLNALWAKCQALDPNNITKLLYSKAGINFFKRELKNQFKNKFDDNEILEAIKGLLTNQIDLEGVNLVKPKKTRKPKSNTVKRQSESPNQ